MVKVLSVKNPWSFLICHGIKDIENRTWDTKHRGELYIHSSGQPIEFISLDHLPLQMEKEILKKRTEAIEKGIITEYIETIEQLRKIPFTEETKSVKELQIFNFQYQEKNKKEYFISKAIIGKVDLVDIVRDSKSVWANPDCFHWVIKNPVLFSKPVTMVKGRLKIWNYIS